MKSIALSIIRTVVPLLAGQIITWLATIGVVDTNGEINAALVATFTLVFTSLYYAGARILEEKLNARFGWLLGAPSVPKYEK